MNPLPHWMRQALYATAGMNILVGLVLLTSMGRQVFGLPEAPAVYVLTVSLFVIAFGCAYLRAAVAGKDERLFLALAAGGKLGFVLILVALWMAGELPTRTPILGSADVLFAALFFRHLTSS